MDCGVFPDLHRRPDAKDKQIPFSHRPEFCLFLGPQARLLVPMMFGPASIILIMV
jgi:hypothetical protein